MTPLKYYQKNFTHIGLANPKKESQTRWAETELPERFFNGKYPMDYMNDLMIPSEQDIMNAQLLNVRWNYPYDESLTDSMNELSEERFHLNEWSSQDFSMQDMLDIIEAVFTTTFTGEDGSLSREVIDALSTKLTSVNYDRDHAHYEQALDKLNMAYQLFTQNQSFISESGMRAALDRLEAAIGLLESDLANGGGSDYNYKKGYFRLNMSGQSLKVRGKNIKSWRDEKKNGKTKQYDDTILGYGNTLKGRWFEKMVIEFLKKHVIDTKEIGIIDTANLKGPTFNVLGGISSSDKTSRTDALMFRFDNLIEIEYYFGGNKKKAKLDTFMKDCDTANKSGTDIKIDAGEWESLIASGAVSGIQSKSGKNQSIINDYKVKPYDAYKLAGNKWAMMFNHMINWYSHGHIYATNDDYDAIFNFGISHALNYIIGIGNNYLAIRNRIIPTAIYMEEQIQLARYIRARRKVDFKNPEAEIPVTLSGTEAGWNK